MSLPVPATDSHARNPSPRVNVLVCFALASVGLVAWHLHYSFQLFSEVDGGLLINAAWLQLNGAVPYRDFYTAYPPLFLLPASWAFLWFGPAWASFAKLLCLFSLCTFAWTFLLLWRVTALPWRSLWGALVLQLLTMLPLSWWWYNEVTALVAVIFYASFGGVAIHPTSLFLRVSLILSEALLGMGKVNVAAPLLLLGVLFLLLHHRSRSIVITATLAACVLDFGVLAWNRISLFTLLYNYALASGDRLSYRVWRSIIEQPGGLAGEIGFDLAVLAAVAAGIAISLAKFQGSRERMEIASLFVIAVLAGLAGTMFDFAGKALHTGYLVTLLFFLCPVRLWPAYGVGWFAQRACALSVGLCVLLNVYLGATRTVFRYYGVLSYVNPALWQTVNVPPLFKGMQLSPHTVETLHDAAQALQAAGWNRDFGKAIFFGPHVDYCYAAFNIPAPANLPLWWEGVPAVRAQIFDVTIFAFDDVPAWRYPHFPRGHALDPRVQNFFNAKFDVCIFMVDSLRHPYMSYLPVDIRYELFRDYRMTFIGHVVLFQRQVP